ncbi:hypothetical protein [Dyella silvae]|uniref:hypothetical protein n=1 Tax=Dyella silvae TaxID=2994424 RepID=UPI0022640E8C|nr:hypothetical protein [Dyella silvae]
MSIPIAEDDRDTAAHMAAGLHTNATHTGSSMLLEHACAFHFDLQTGVVETHIGRLCNKTDR